ncbi:MAG: galactose-1-phosphate uridylyltransferase [Deltaproteobacteria bacterium]|nr:galactose-1-phosphate uridylyltransferase [Deltaproteobacteria bacterium]
MSELRQDPIHRHWVVVAPEVAPRLEPVRAEPPPGAAGSCPFCPGNERATPPEVLSLRAEPSGSGPWCVRVVPNRVPALRVERDLHGSAKGVHRRLDGLGAHEVVVESPDHEATLADMTDTQVGRVMEAWQSRQRDLFEDRRLAHVLVYKNHGAQAGARLAHPHSQILAMPVTPAAVATRMGHALDRYRDHGRCVFCDLLEQELHDGSRIVHSDPHFVVLCPYASRVPFELLVMPRRHGPAFTQATPDEITALARILRDALHRLDAGLGNPPYNLVLHTGPNPQALAPTVTPGPDLDASWHWHLEILPRLLPIGGFEWASGGSVNPTPPEDAAAFLRGLSPQATPCT